METHHLSETRFDSFDLPPGLAQGIREAGFEYCTPIQSLALPIALNGIDIAGQAQTGTGKSAAFLVATFNHLMRNPTDERRHPTQPRALIVAPTRELAIQIHKDATALGAHTGLRLALVFGGADYDGQRKQLEAGSDVLIGTPGRIIDYFKQHIFDLKAIQVVVLDEADRMFDLGFIKDIRFLMRRMPSPAARLNMLFSATLSWRVLELAYEHMNSPQKVTVEVERKTAERITESVYMPSDDEKLPLLVGLFRQQQPYRSLVFVNTKHVAERVAATLRANEVRADVLSGDVPQNKRMRLLERFSEGELPVLVATDVAARGLHIPEVSHVYNFDLPQDPEDYVHRIGRTGRAGASGAAISLACERYAFSLMEIEAYTGHKLERAAITADLLPAITRPPRPPRREGERAAPRRGGGAPRRSGARRPRRPG